MTGHNHYIFLLGVVLILFILPLILRSWIQLRQWRQIAQSHVEQTRELERVRKAMFSMLEDMQRDNAYRKNTEAELKRLLRELELSNNELYQANEKLKELDKLKSNFIMMASHELRTPLASIIGYLALLLDNKAGQVTPPQRDFLDRIHLATERLRRMLTDLLNLSKMESGQIVFEFKPHRMENVLKDQVRIFQGQAHQKEIKMTLEVENDLGEAVCDENRMGEAVGNYLNNAVKYTPRNGKIWLRARRNEEAIVIEVEDNGLGILEDKMSRIFEPFFHVHSVPFDGEESSGLGLALVKEIVERHHGKVKVESVLSKGSKFSMILPVIYNTHPPKKYPEKMSQ